MEQANPTERTSEVRRQEAAPVAAKARAASVYVHFPWCLAKCPYCDFVSYASPRESIDHDGYADAVIRELDSRAASFQGRDVRSIFFGGGTPSLWASASLGRVIVAIREALGMPKDDAEVEITAECNPTSLDADSALALRDAGVNRLSVGTQALREEQLKFLGRLHDSAGATRAVDDAIRSGLRVSTDLIFGMPEQAPEDARDQALALADRGLRHLSCYQLTIEPGTRFGELAKRGRLPMADAGRVAEAFLAIDEALATRGLVHYEISNYAQPGEEARHNLSYWRGHEYLGLGCGAYGFVRAGTNEEKDNCGGTRYRDTPDPKMYMQDPRSGETDEPLDGETLLRERIMLGLRLRAGFDLKAAADDLGVQAWTAERRREADKLVARGRLAVDGDHLYIPTSAWLWTDDTAARLF